MEKQNVNIKLNLLKGFACISVVFIHITFPGIFGQVVKKACAFAVPIFYMIAGYYAWGKGTEVIKRRLDKIIKIFLYAYTLFFLFQVVYAAMNHQLSIWFSENFNWNTPIKYIWFCTIDFALPLWYLIAMAEIYIVWYFIVKNRKESIVLKFIPVLFVLQIVLTSYCETMQLAWFWKINFLTCAMPWFLFGYYMHTSNADKFRNMASNKLIFFIVVGCFISIIPTILDLPIKFNEIGYIPYVFGVFTICLKNQRNSVCKIIEYIGEKLSLNIYVFHVLIGSMLNFICSKIFGLNVNGNIWLWCRPIIVLLCTIFASWLVYIMWGLIKKISRKRHH